jgi:cytochrome P450
MGIAIDDLPLLDEGSAEYLSDPITVLNDVRNHSWLARSTMGVTVLTYDKVQQLFHDQRLVQPHVRMLEASGITSGRMYDAAFESLATKDGPDHSRLRRLVAPFFVPKAIDRFRPLMRSLINEAVDAVAPAGRCDFTRDIAVGYPMAVICRMLGVPDTDRPRFHHWLDEEMRMLEWGDLNRMEHTVYDDIFAYLQDLLEARRRNPGDDLITQLLAAEDEGDRLTHAEVIWAINTFMGAGQDTTRCQLGWAVYTFLSHLDQWDRLAAHPELAPSAAEEVLRFIPTLINLPKIAIEDLEIDGVRIPAGTAVFMSFPAANRDPAVYPNPDRFDIGRFDGARQGPPPMTFGHGAHFCLGAPLARAELSEALAILPGRLRDPELDGPVEWRPVAGVTGPNAFPLRFRTV